ncbi:MAG: endonuclease III domain-containing protein [bacterium]
MKKDFLLDIYQRLYNFYGPQHWWPAETAFEMIVGAILTQNTAWTNVEKAIVSLKKNGLLNIKSLKDIDVGDIAIQVKPTGYYNVKARRLKTFIDFLVEECDGNLVSLFKSDSLYECRDRLLSVKGIGEETADSILLYAGEKPIFVVDAYTKRILSRHNVIKEDSDYSEVQRLFMDNLPQDVKLFNEYHALIVRVGKGQCNKRPKCEGCPLCKN